MADTRHPIPEVRTKWLLADLPILFDQGLVLPGDALFCQGSWWIAGGIAAAQRGRWGDVLGARRTHVATVGRSRTVIESVWPAVREIGLEEWCAEWAGLPVELGRLPDLSAGMRQVISANGERIARARTPYAVGAIAVLGRAYAWYRPARWRTELILRLNPDPPGESYTCSGLVTEQHRDTAAWARFPEAWRNRPRLVSPCEQYESRLWRIEATLL